MPRRIFPLLIFIILLTKNCGSVQGNAESDNSFTSVWSAFNSPGQAKNVYTVNTNVLVTEEKEDNPSDDECDEEDGDCPPIEETSVAPLTTINPSTEERTTLPEYTTASTSTIAPTFTTAPTSTTASTSTIAPTSTTPPTTTTMSTSTRTLTSTAPPTTTTASTSTMAPETTTLLTSTTAPISTTAPSSSKASTSTTAPAVSRTINSLLTTTAQVTNSVNADCNPATTSRTTTTLRPSTTTPAHTSTTEAAAETTTTASTVKPTTTSTLVSEPSITSTPTETTVKPTTTPASTSTEAATTMPKSTTKTQRPTTQPNVPVLKGICDGCVLSHGVGYVANLKDCTKYYQCSNRDKNTMTVAERSCSFGLYWNQNILSCDYPGNVPCKNDICHKGAKNLISSSNCRGFWDCSSGMAVGRCCPLGESFDETTGTCRRDLWCADDCLSSDVGVIRCDKKSIPWDKAAYLQKTTTSWIRMPCPAFTSFSENFCGCALINSKGRHPECIPELFLPFDRDTSDHSPNSLHVTNNGVSVFAGKAYFDGKSNLTVPRFSNAWFGGTVAITVKYKPEDSSSRQALACNGDCGVWPSLFVGSSNYGVEFYAKTYASLSAVNFTVPVWNYGYKHALFLLDDGDLTGTVGNRGRSYVTYGPLETRPRALTIGSCMGADNFKGKIDEIAVYLCNKRDS